MKVPNSVEMHKIIYKDLIKAVGHPDWPFGWDLSHLIADISESDWNTSTTSLTACFDTCISGDWIPWHQDWLTASDYPRCVRWDKFYFLLGLVFCFNQWVNAKLSSIGNSAVIDRTEQTSLVASRLWTHKNSSIAWYYTASLMTTYRTGILSN